MFIKKQLRNVDCLTDVNQPKRNKAFKLLKNILQWEKIKKVEVKNLTKHCNKKGERCIRKIWDG